jgi:acyl carrier protein
MPDSDSDVEHIAERVVEIWRSVLQTPDVDLDTNLLNLAASSLAAVRIRSRIRAELGKEIELLDILEQPTPRELAGAIAAAPVCGEQEPWHQLDWSD